MSCIYEIKCTDCLKELEFTVKLDSADDLIVEVEPCPVCMEVARQEDPDQ